MSTACDLYLDWHTGSDGNAITDAIAAGSCRPTSPTDTVDAYPGATLTAMFIETDSASPVAGYVTCGGVEYNFDDTTQGALYDHTSNYSDIVSANTTSGPSVMSMGFMYKTDMDTDWAWHAMSGIVGTGDWAILSSRNHDGSQHCYLEVSNGYSDGIEIDAGTWYWVTIQYNRTTAYGYLSVYDPSTWEQVGVTVSRAFDASPTVVAYWVIGQNASQGNTEAASTWYGPAIFDWTDGTFPLLPSVGPSGTVAYEAFIGGPQGTPIYVSPSLVLGNAWDMTLTKISGTNRTITWSIRKIASGAITEAFAGTQSVTTDEHSLPRDAVYDGPVPQTGDGLYQVFLDVNELVGGDLFRFRIYEETTA